MLQDRGGEHLVPALPLCGLCDALVLVLLEALQDLDSALCKNKCVEFHAWLYDLLGGAAEKLVTPPSKRNDATRCLLSAAITGCEPFNKATRRRSQSNAMLSTAPPRRRLGNGPLCSIDNSLWTSLVRGVCSTP